MNSEDLSDMLIRSAVKSVLLYFFTVYKIPSFLAINRIRSTIRME
jgi:hypothetical protein